jgi:gamma-glutamylcyclotransferase (GGCT)/AIG2-like uncharacterized protein YtfP
VTTPLFCYGALDPVRLENHLGHAVRTEGAYAQDHMRVFRGYSMRWGGGVATLARARGARTYGLLAEVSRNDLAELDAIEGVPITYTRRKMVVHRADGSIVEAWVYLSTRTPDFPPSKAYREAIEKTIATHWR